MPSIFKQHPDGPLKAEAALLSRVQGVGARPNTLNRLMLSNRHPVFHSVDFST
jgi:hypothetical protein